PGALPVALPFALFWLSAPELARRSGQPQVRPALASLSSEQVLYLRRLARRTYRYFERYVSAASNALPPDNYQEDPPALAERTSPTNIAMYLLSALAARDLGWASLGTTVERIEATLETLGR